MGHAPPREEATLRMARDWEKVRGIKAFSYNPIEVRAVEMLVNFLTYHIDMLLYGKKG